MKFIQKRIYIRLCIAKVKNYAILNFAILAWHAFNWALIFYAINFKLGSVTSCIYVCTKIYVCNIAVWIHCCFNKNLIILYYVIDHILQLRYIKYAFKIMWTHIGIINLSIRVYANNVSIIIIIVNYIFYQN